MGIDRLTFACLGLNSENNGVNQNICKKRYHTLIKPIYSNKKTEKFK